MRRPRGYFDAVNQGGRPFAINLTMKLSTRKDACAAAAQKILTNDGESVFVIMLMKFW